MTSTVNGTSAAAANSNIAGAQQSLAGDQQMFLQLLTAQLKNQDPTSPLDPSQFTQQLVVMTGVQQQLLTNQLLQSMLTNQGGVASAVGLVGKSVTVNTPAATVNDGKADWTYTLNGSAKDVTLQVIDASGNIVYSTDAGALATGDHAFTWDGKGSDGVQRADGQTYGLQVVAKDAQGAAISAQVAHTGIVKSVLQQNGQTLVDVDGLQIPLSLITSVGSA